MCARKSTRMLTAGLFDSKKKLEVTYIPVDKKTDKL